MNGRSWVKVALVMTLGMGSIAAIAAVDGMNASQASTMPLPQPGDPEADFSERETQVEQAANQFIDALNRGEYKQARRMLSPGLATELSEDALEDRWKAATDVVGSYIGRGRTRYSWAASTDFVAMELLFENTNDTILIIFDSDQTISGVDFPSLREAESRIVAEKFIDALSEGRFLDARMDFHPALKTELFPDEIQEKWDTLQLQTGTFRRRVSTSKRSSESYDIVDVSLEFENLTESMLVFVNQNNQILGIDFPIEVPSN